MGLLHRVVRHRPPGRPAAGRQPTTCSRSSPGSDSTDRRATVELVVAYHLLWELTHVVFEHAGAPARRRRCRRRPAGVRDLRRRGAPIGEVLTAAATRPTGAHRRLDGLRGHEPGRRARASAISSSSTPASRSLGWRRRPVSSTDFLYPFIEADERDVDGLLADLASLSTREGARESAVAGGDGGPVCRRAHPPPRRQWGRLPPWRSPLHVRQRRKCHRRPVGSRPVRTHTHAPSGELPTVCLTNAPAVLTALGNDVGFDLVFARSLEAIGGEGDLRPRVLHERWVAQRAPRLRDRPSPGMLTVGLAGYDGGAMADQRRRRPLPRRPISERAPHPGSADRAPRPTS